MRPKLRNGNKRESFDLYEIGVFPKNMVYEICKRMAYYYAIGKTDISGEDWGDIFSYAIDGEHLSSPLGLADIVKEGQSWSIKSIKNINPHKCHKVRVISGRNSPDYSYGLSDPRANIQETGDAVLAIWNERISIALDNFDSLRTVILIRNFNTLEFTLFEMQTLIYVTKDYEWKENKRGNFEGYEKISGFHKFTWQPHGSQFTIFYKVPGSAIKFKLKRPPMLDFNKVMKDIGFSEEWITIIEND